MRKPLVSIIVCTHNTERNIYSVLNSVTKQSYKRKEIIVVDDFSTDRTRNIIDKFKKIIKIYNKKNLRFSKSFNRGVRKAMGNIIISLHDDCVPIGKKWIDQMIGPFSDKSVGAVSSQRIVKPEMSISEKLFNSVANQSLIINTKKPIPTGYTRFKADAYRKELFDKIGLLDEKLFYSSGQDNVFSIKMKEKGYKILISNKAKVKYLFSSEQNSFFNILKKSFIMTQSSPALYKKYRYDGMFARVSMYGFLLLISSLILSFFSKWFIMIMLIPLLFYFYYSLATMIRNRKLGALMPIVFIFAFLWKVLLGIGYLKALVKK